MCTMNDRHCTWRVESKPITRTYALGYSVVHARTSSSTWRGSVQPNMGSFHITQ